MVSRRRLKSDNRPPFNIHNFEEYAKEEGFKHLKVTPGCVEAYDDVERFMQRTKKTARMAALEGNAVRDGVCRGVWAYSATEHETTGISPNTLIFGKELRGKFPKVKGLPKHSDNMMIRHRDRKQTQKIKQYADKRRHTAIMKIKAGDTLLCKQERKNSLTPLYDPDPMVVIGVILE